jgi:hypothetical protein
MAKRQSAHTSASLSVADHTESSDRAAGPSRQIVDHEAQDQRKIGASLVWTGRTPVEFSTGLLIQCSHQRGCLQQVRFADELVVEHWAVRDDKAMLDAVTV